jgi:hypothetical protein
VVFLGHAILLFRYFSGWASRMPSAEALVLLAGKSLAIQPWRPPAKAHLRTGSPADWPFTPQGGGGLAA